MAWVWSRVLNAGPERLTLEHIQNLNTLTLIASLGGAASNSPLDLHDAFFLLLPSVLDTEVVLLSESKPSRATSSALPSHLVYLLT